LVLFVRLCKTHAIEVAVAPEPLPNPADVLALLLPGCDFPAMPSVRLSLVAPVRFGLKTLRRFFDASVDRVIDLCLDTHQLEEAQRISVWRNRDPQNIELLIAVQRATTGRELTPDQAALLAKFGSTKDMPGLLAAIAAQNGWRFPLFSLHYRAAAALNLKATDLLHRKTSEFIESPLAVTIAQWPLVRALVQASKLPIADLAGCLVSAFVAHVTKLLTTVAPPQAAQLSADDYGERFLEFTKLCENPGAIGEQLLAIAKSSQAAIAVRTNLLLHASLCASDLDDCAQALESLLEELTAEHNLGLLLEVVTVFPEPSLLPLFFRFLVEAKKIEMLPQSKMSDKLIRVLMNSARHLKSFNPSDYIDLTQKYQLFRDHAELHFECGNRLLVGSPDRSLLQEASTHFLLALAYFLQEKCYSLSMECLKTMSLISLQSEQSETQILHLEKPQVLRLMCQKDFPFAFIIAVAYDMDTEANWAEALYAQCVAGRRDEFFDAFAFFRAISTNLCEGIVRKYRTGAMDDDQQARMKSFLDRIPNLIEQYRFAKLLNFADHVQKMKTRSPIVCEWCERIMINQ
jgi:spatacsin